MSIVLVGSTSGSVTLQEPAVAGTTVIDLPATSGTMVVTGGAQTVQFAAGSASTPSITFTGDTNTGIFSPGADTIAFSEGGVESMRIDSSGNVGIGTSSPQATLDVSYGNASRADTLRLTNPNTAGYGSWLNFYGNYNGGYSFAKIGTENDGTGGSMRFHTADTSEVSQERMRIDSSGNVGIGTTSPTAYGAFAVQKTITISSLSGISAGFSDGTTGTLRIAHASGQNILNFDTSALCFQSGGVTPVERMRIDSDGNILLNGTSSAGSNVKIQTYSASGNGAQGWIGSFTGGSGGGRANQNVGYMIGQSDLKMYTDWDGSGNPRNKINVQAQSAGVQLTSGATSWASLSDERQKDIIEPITNAANKVSSLRTVIGKYKNDEEGRRRVFLIAQDVQAVLPEAIVVEDEGQESETLLLAYTDVIPLLVAAIKEQQAIITDLKARIETLENK